MKASKIPVANISVQCFLNNEFSNPRITQLPNKLFQPSTHSSLGDHLQLSLTSEDIERGINISLDVPMQDGIFLSTYEEDGRDYYQLAVLPQEALPSGVSPPKKVAVLIDYDADNTTISKQDLLTTIEKELINNLKPTDLFNVLLATSDGVQLMSPNWINAQEQLIVPVFNLIEETLTLSDDAQLETLLQEGTEFINSHGKEGTLLVVSSSDEFREQENADAAIQRLKPLIGDATINIHVADYTDKRNFWDFDYYGSDWDEAWQIYNQWTKYYGNEYFYTLLNNCLLYTSPSPRDAMLSRMPSSA